MAVPTDLYDYCDILVWALVGCERRIEMIQQLEINGKSSEGYIVSVSTIGRCLL